MPKRDRGPDVSRFWPRLREEAHDLYREVGTLRGQVRQLEKELTREKNAADRLRERDATLNAQLEDARARLRRIERSKGWRLIMAARGLVRRRKRAVPETEAETPEGRPEDQAPPARSGPEPTFAQRRAAEAARRGQVAAVLKEWISTARAARGSSILVVAGEPSDAETKRFIEAARVANEPVLVLEADPRDGVGGLPAGIVPTLVPDLLAMDAGEKSKLFLCATPGHAAIRWVVPAQEQGWWTAVVHHGPISPAAIYLASHADVAVVSDDDAARALEAASGVRPIANPAPSARDLLDAARPGWESLPRAVLGSD
jgi:hypothetical protein